MLNENLSKIRKERGLTQEALAVKLNVVRQTISKWENGTAVPDADTLCRIAEALDVSVSELLGSATNDDKIDTAIIAKSLAEINEQLAIRNRRGSRVLKIVCGIVIGFFLLLTIVIVLNIAAKPPVNANKDELVPNQIAVRTNSIELDENGVPLFYQVNQKNEYDLSEFFGSENLTDELFIQSWGEPAIKAQNKLSWQISNDKVFTVYFTDSRFAYDCSIESK